MLICDKYKPVKSEEILGFDHIDDIESVIKSQSKAIFVLYGESGCGKTSLIDFFVQKFKFKEIK